MNTALDNMSKAASLKLGKIFVAACWVWGDWVSSNSTRGLLERGRVLGLVEEVEVDTWSTSTSALVDATCINWDMPKNKTVIDQAT